MYTETETWDPFESSRSSKKMKLEEIEFIDEIYPRKEVSWKNVNRLVEKLKAGKKLDPIIVQKVNEDGELKIISLDGKHRIIAYKEFNKLEDYDEIEKVEVEYWKNKTLDFEKHRDELLIKSYQLNDSHGLNVHKRDVKKTARALRKRNPSWSTEKIGKKLNRDKSTIHHHIKDIIQEQKASEHSLIIKLSRLGWTQNEIANHSEVSVKRTSVGKKVKKLDIQQIHTLFDKEKSIDTICKVHDIDSQTAWSIILEGKSDLERFKIFGRSEYGDNEAKMVDKWEFTRPDPRIGNDYPGRLDGQAVLNILYHHTELGDLVVDPFAGGGSSIDACLIMGRECRAYDIKPSRGGILQNDIRDGYPREAKGADIILLDPPYGDKMVDEYGANGFTESRETIIENIEKLAKDSYETLSSQGRVAFIYGNHKGQKDGGDIWAPDLYQFFRDVGFETEFIYHVPSKGHPSPTGQIQQRSRDLYIFKK